MHQIVRKSLLTLYQTVQGSPPFAKGRNIAPLWQRGGRGDFQSNEYSIMSSLIDTEEKTNVRKRK